MSEKSDTALVLLFLDDSTDSMIGRLRLSTDVALNGLLNGGGMQLVCLSVNRYSAEWAKAAAGFADNWTIGCGENLARVLSRAAISLTISILSSARVCRLRV